VSVDFQLKETAVALDEVVVTATGEVRKKEVGTSLSAISSRDIEVAPVQNTQDIISGRATGVTVMANAGAPGAGGTIRLRGNNSISQGNNPLIYVDGVRIYSGNGPAAWASHQSTLPLNDINADDIERVEIVKGAAATTLYGTEASGGVIQIFTKKGVVGSPIWSAEVGLGLNTLGHVGPKEDPTGLFLNQCTGPELVDSQGNTFADPTCPESGSWLQDGGIQRYSLSVRGGGDRMTYFLSGNFNDEAGAIETGWSRDGGFRGNFTFRPADKLEIGMSSAYTKRTTRWVPDGNNASGFLLNVTRGNANYFKKADECEGMSVGTCVVNGFILDQENFNRTDHFVSGFTVNYNPSDAFSHRMALGYDYNAADNATHYPFGYLRSPQGFIFGQVWNHTTLSLDYVGSFNNRFGSNVTSAFSWGGQLFQDTDRLAFLNAYDFAGPGTPTLGTAARTEISREDRLRVINAGLFLQEVVGINDQLFITAGLRVDGNSAFGEDFGLQPYPKVSASYVLSDHAFWPGGWWETMKLRAAVGESGKAPGAFDAVRTWQAIAGEDAQPGFTPYQLGNPTLGPERSRETEVGFESSMFDGRLGLDVTYFHQNTFDALVPVREAPSSGFLRTQLQNVGTLQNTGLEIGVDAALVRSAAVDWRARLNVSSVESEAVDLNGEDINVSWDNYIREGHPVPAYFGTVITNPDEIADPVMERDQYIGPSYPTRTVGLGTTLTLFNDLSLDVLGEYQGGHYLANWVGYQNARRGVWRPCYDVQQKLRAFAAGDASALAGVTARERGLCAIDRRVMNNDFWIQPADFFKLRSISLTYDLPEQLLVGARKASITLAGRNLLTSTDYDGIDPEVSELGQYLRRAEYYNLPPLRSIVASVRVTF
jgi:TonB-linked SusC/RagA family outer membrane protein